METSRVTSTTAATVDINDQTFPFGESMNVIDVDGVSRRYLVVVPPGLDEPRAVVVVLHGGGGLGLGVAETGKYPLAVFRDVATEEGFVVVYPEGLPNEDRRDLLGWVDCRSDNTVASDADDVAFLEVLIDDLASEYELPNSNIFLAGSSNGAQMVQAFAFHRPEKIGAVASGAGSLPLNPRPGSCTEGPPIPVPILMVHGTSDAMMPFAGGCVADLGGACLRGRVVSAEETRDRWLAINGLSEVVPVESIVEIDESDGGAAHRFVFDGVAPLEWWRLDGGGHASPSRSVFVESNRAAGVQNRDVEFARVVWEFFERRLPAE